MNCQTSIARRLDGRTQEIISHILKGALLAQCLTVLFCQKNDPIATALATRRPGEARLVGAPWFKSGNSGPTEVEVLRRADRAATHLLETRPNAASYRAAAAVNLLAGKVDLAVGQLTKAAELYPRDAALWSDLSAAHLQRSAKDSYELVPALSAAHHAVHLDSRLEAARFNRALALERMSLRRPALEDWRWIQENEAGTPWAQESQKHALALERLTPASGDAEWEKARDAIRRRDRPGLRRLVFLDRQGFRERVEKRLLADWASAEVEGRRKDAIHTLETAEAIADTLAAAGGDRLAADTIAHIREAQSSSPQKLSSVASGLNHYFRGMSLLDLSSFGEALQQFEQAQEILASEQSPFSLLASYQIGVCKYQKSGYAAARKDFEALARQASERNYLAVLGRVRYTTALLDTVVADFSEPIAYLEESLKAFEEIKEPSNVAQVRSSLGATLGALGQPREAWRYLYPALIEPASYHIPRTRIVICEYASWQAQQVGENQIALWLQDEVVRSSLEWQRPDAVAGAFRQRAKLLALVGRFRESRQDLQQARSFQQRIKDSSAKLVVEGDILLAESELGGLSPQREIEQLDRVIEILSATSYNYQLGYAFSRRARAHQALGQVDTAERDLSAAIQELERQRETVEMAQNRASYFDRIKEVFDSMVAFQLDQRNRPEEALRYSEQAKARVLWDWMVTSPSSQPKANFQPSAAKSSDLGTLRGDLPESTVVLEYSVLPKRALLWAFRKSGKVLCVTAGGNSEKLAELALRFRRAILNNQAAEQDVLARQLYDLLIRPIAPSLAPGERLVIIPDGALHTLPFSLLKDPAGKHLLESHAVALAPSAGTYLTGLRHERSLPPPRRALIVTAPDFDVTVDPSLGILTSGDQEASIASIFPGSEVLRGAEAKRDTFLAAASGLEMIYFGGHSQVNSEVPLLSRMLFAKDATDPARGVLYSGDLLGRRFPRTRLVVLASCSTALGKNFRAEGVENLARPFLAAGVPTVVASLWNVDDATTADFYVRFFQRVRNRFDIAEALRDTQLESLRRGLPPESWGGFVVIGGGSPAP